MSKRIFAKRWPLWLAGALFVVAVLVVGAEALVSADTPFTAPTGVIHACVLNAPNNAQVRIIGANASCGPNETPLHWNAQGPAGPPGSPGVSGYQINSGGTPWNSDSPKALNMPCPPGKAATGGGGFFCR